MSLNEKSFKQLNEMVEEVAYRFFIAKKMDNAKNKGEMLSEENPPYLVYMLRVERAYRSLDERERNLINNEFFFQNYHNWWVGLYSRTSFYRFKKRTMLRFLEAFLHV
ncbi:MAG: hypothetical protein IK028_02775 [Bacilli bacterium]|nr:hypothetical protein [Bacilli bacterium]